MQVLDFLSEAVMNLGYAGALLAGFLGSSSLFIAIFPSFIVVPLLGTVLNPLLVGIFAGLGAGVGQYIHYYVGSGGRTLLRRTRTISPRTWRIGTGIVLSFILGFPVARLIETWIGFLVGAAGFVIGWYVSPRVQRIVEPFLPSEEGGFEKWKRRIEKYGVLLIFAFAATPASPDDIIWIPLGFIGYPKLKALAAALAGKTVLNIFYAYAGYYGWEFIRNLI